MAITAIKIENLSKQYRLGVVGTGTLSHDLKRWWTVNMRGKEDPYLKIGETNDRSTKASSEYVWALKDINLEIKKGDVVGIIGKNGAGKSTLLKILSKVTKPTTGTVQYKGRIASLLEVGTGFHMEMTGRENIYMNGSIMGMTRTEITRKLDEIIDFAGVERFIDTPVKRYSSGMTVRLGFAIAAHLEPEILVVDEVLAVGDAEFQKKAIGKMQDVSKGDGRTVLFVSHNMSAVKSLCEKSILLSSGIVEKCGFSEEIIKHYLQNFQNLNKLKSDWGSNYPVGENIEVISAEVSSKYNFSISHEIYVSFEFHIEIEMRQFNACIVLYSVENEHILTSISNVTKLNKGNHTANLTIPPNFLNNSTYRIRLILMNQPRALINIFDVLHFEAIENEGRECGWYGNIEGFVRPKLDWILT